MENQKGDQGERLGGGCERGRERGRERGPLANLYYLLRQSPERGRASGPLSLAMCRQGEAPAAQGLQSYRGHIIADDFAVQPHLYRISDILDNKN